MTDRYDTYAVTANQEIGQRLQEKYDFYLVALTFTILGLAAQTANFGVFVGADLAELAAWVALLKSGLSGLARLERLPRIYELFSVEAEQKGFVDHLRTTSRAKGIKSVTFTGDNVTVPLEEAVRRVEKNVEVVRGVLEPIEAAGLAAGKAQRFAFAWGITMLVIARGLPPLLEIIQSLLALF